MRIVVEALDLIIIDTLARTTSQVDGGDPAQTTAVLGRRQHMASVTGCTILAIDHHRKQSRFDAGPVGDMSPALALPGAAPAGAPPALLQQARVFHAVLVLYRKQGAPKAVLHAVGRDTEDEQVAVTFHSATAWTRKTGATIFRRASRKNRR